jgi:hypothetical protein
MYPYSCLKTGHDSSESLTREMHPSRRFLASLGTTSLKRNDYFDSD